ncbi:MAG: glycoside hydrolase family 48 protein [Desulfobacterales bacterium]
MLGCELYGSVLYGSQIAPPGVVIVAAWSVEADLYGAVVYGTARMEVEHHELGGRYVYVLQIDAPPTGKIDWLFDDVMLDASVLDEWDGCVRFSYQWTEQGPVLWRGPMYSGYQCPPAWELAGEHEIAAKLMAFLRKAQEVYAERYAADPGPFMPVWVPLAQENPAEYGGEVRTWGWAGPDVNTNWAGFQYRALAASAHYYYLTGSADARTVLDNWVSWLSTRILDDVAGGWRLPSDFVKNSASIEYNYFSPDFHALVVQAMIFKYWRDGDPACLLWARRLLDDLEGRQRDDGLFPMSSGEVYLFHQGEVGKALGMLLNGRTGGIVAYELRAGPGDRAAFEKLVSGLLGARGRAKPCALDFDDWLPLHHFYDVAQQLSEKIWVGNTCGTSEGIGSLLMLALDWALYSGDKTWFKKMARFLNQELGLFVTD